MPDVRRPTMTEPLIAEPTEEDARDWSSMEGTGVVSSWADFAGAGDPVEAAFAGTGAALDSLGFLADPFDAFLSSAIGYLIEHIWFLHEPLDALAGDPTQITAQARTWAKVATALRGEADSYGTSARATTAWEGAAGDAYRSTAAAHTDSLRTAADRSTDLAGTVLATGALVGTERALIRDLIADALASWAERLLISLLLAPETMGGSTAAALGWVLWDAIALAARFADRISELLDSLAAAGGAAARIADGIRSSASALGDTARYAHDIAVPTNDTVETVPVGEAVELGKQLSGAPSLDPDDAGDDQAGS